MASGSQKQFFLFFPCLSQQDPFGMVWPATLPNPPSQFDPKTNPPNSKSPPSPRILSMYSRTRAYCVWYSPSVAGAHGIVAVVVRNRYAGLRVLRDPLLDVVL